MTDDTSNAFAHPSFRAVSMPIEGVHDRLSLRDHVVEVEIGAFQVERDMTQRVSFDVVVEVAAPDADLEDDVDRILSYDRLTWAIETELATQRLNLLETLAEGIADRMLAEPQALRVFVRIQKLDKGNGKLGVEIVRVPGQGDAKGANQTAPIVVFLGVELFAITELLDLVDRNQDEALVFVLGLPTDRPLTQDINAQRQIDLLAIEQAAWALSAKLYGVSVAATRTELDWAMKNSKPCIWAPSKLVNDAADTPPETAAGLAIWFAQQWGAKKLLDFGGTLPASDTIPAEIVTVGHTAD